jgi:predicted dehydrogenase
MGAGNAEGITAAIRSQLQAEAPADVAALQPALAAAAAQAQAEKYEIKAFTVDEMIGSDEIDLVINLTIPAVHGQVALQVLNAGKHVHNEKPLAPNREEAREMLRIAKEKGLTIGCAPDTFLGAAHQHVRKLIESGIIGPVVGVHGYMTSRGVESWHPNPEFFYKPGAGPMLDMGPYYLTAMVNMFGPICRVASITNIIIINRERFVNKIWDQCYTISKEQHHQQHQRIAKKC